MHMFDEPTPPANLPTGQGAAPELEDIFDKVEPAAKPAAPPFVSEAPAVSASKPAMDMPTPAPVTAEPGVAVKEPLIASRRVMVIIGVVVGVLVVFGVGFAAFRFIKRTATPPAPPTGAVVPEATPSPEIPSLPTPLPTPEAANVPPLETEVQPEVSPLVAEPSAPVDSDGDGLTDEAESTQGTNAQNPDSDNDGLFDGEEVQTYETNPLSADTDGDTFLDGQEVRNGYNPKGEGRLFSVPTQ